nr:exo-alpha-sialidase [Clostridia bacterium]
LLLDEREMVSYPDAAISGDSITVIYDRDRYGKSEIMTAHIKEDEIIKGSLLHEDSYLKNIISSRDLKIG